MKWLLIIILVADYQALTPVKKTEFRSATTQLIVGTGDKDSFASWWDVNTNKYMVVCLSRDQVDGNMTTVSSYARSVSNNMSHSKVEFSQAPWVRMLELGIQYSEEP